MGRVKRPSDVRVWPFATFSAVQRYVRSWGRLDQIVALTKRYAVPAISQFREFAAAGGLITYGPKFGEAHREVGILAGRILKGEKPADLPVIQLNKFELVINMKAAKALGIEVPVSMQILADEVIE
jgi:putative ABC transport system substrate-binding protein